MVEYRSFVISSVSSVLRLVRRLRCLRVSPSMLLNSLKHPFVLLRVVPRDGKAIKTTWKKPVFIAGFYWFFSKNFWKKPVFIFFFKNLFFFTFVCYFRISFFFLYYYIPLYPIFLDNFGAFETHHESSVW